VRGIVFERMIKHTEEKHIEDKVAMQHYPAVTVTSLWLVAKKPIMATNVYQHITFHFLYAFAN